jgi:NAD-dependent SIR2 family protein deacetylase
MEDQRIETIKESNTKNVFNVIAGITRGDFARIVFLVGAGISVDAGYPTFRGSGDDPSESLSRDSPSYKVALALSPFAIKGRPTDFHNFMDEKAYKIYTQNIDSLEPCDSRTTFCHGKISDGASCQKCGERISWDSYAGRMREMHFSCHCGGDIYPNIVLYGDSVNFEPSQAILDLKTADLVICAGTSLQVYPFAELLNHVVSPLLIIEPNINKNHARILSRGDSYLYPGDCQEFARLCMQ